MCSGSRVAERQSGKKSKTVTPRSLTENRYVSKENFIGRTFLCNILLKVNNYDRRLQQHLHIYMSKLEYNIYFTHLLKCMLNQQKILRK